MRARRAKVTLSDSNKGVALDSMCAARGKTWKVAPPGRSRWSLHKLAYTACKSEWHGVKEERDRINMIDRISEILCILSKMTADDQQMQTPPRNPYRLHVCEAKPIPTPAGHCRQTAARLFFLPSTQEVPPFNSCRHGQGDFLSTKV